MWISDKNKSIWFLNNFFQSCKLRKRLRGEVRLRHLDWLNREKSVTSQSANLYPIDFSLSTRYSMCAQFLPACTRVWPLFPLVTVHFDTGQACSLSLPNSCRPGQTSAKRGVEEGDERGGKCRENKPKESAQRPVRPPVCVDILA